MSEEVLWTHSNGELRAIVNEEGLISFEELHGAVWRRGHTLGAVIGFHYAVIALFRKEKQDAR